MKSVRQAVGDTGGSTLAQAAAMGIGMVAMPAFLGTGALAAGLWMVGTGVASQYGAKYAQQAGSASAEALAEKLGRLVC
jgi:hypothetical protein